MTLREEVTFPAHGGWRLAGSLVLPGEPGAPVVICVHGPEDPRDSLHSRQVADDLVRAGIGCMQVDVSGHGGSEGYLYERPEQCAQDMKAAFNFLRSHEDFRESHVGLTGFGLGATAVLYALGVLRVPAIAAVLRAPTLYRHERITAELPVPALVIAGGLDPVLHAFRRALRNMPDGSELREVAGCRRTLAESPYGEVTAAAMVDWFSRSLRRAAGAPV